MPTSRESVPNSPLSGAELREIIRRRCDDLLANFGILSPQMAFGRVAFSVTISLHIDNAMAADHAIADDSRRLATNLVAARPELKAIEPPPLAAASPDAVVLAETLDARIDSPNAERVRHGMPVPVIVRQPDGTRTQEMVKYPPDASLGEGDVTIRDSSAEARQRWGQPEPPADAAPVYEVDPLDDGDNAGQEQPR